MCHQFNEFESYYSSYNKIGIKDAILMDITILKQKLIRKCFRKKKHRHSGICATKYRNSKRDWLDSFYAEYNTT